MGMFEYQCRKCGNKFFEVCNYKNRDKMICSLCKSNDVKRLLSNAHFVMDGKMQTLHSNSPEGQAKATELRKKHIKRHEHREFKAENQERAKKDGKFTYK